MQGSKLYVGNLDYSVTNAELKDLFGKHGEVKEVNVIEGRGFAFVQMSDPSEAMGAKEALDGADFKGRSLKVDEARPARSVPRRDFGAGQRRDHGGRQKRDHRSGQKRNHRRY